jgi:hypothetical protein
MMYTTPVEIKSFVCEVWQPSQGLVAHGSVPNRLAQSEVNMGTNTLLKLYCISCEDMHGEMRPKRVFAVRSTMLEAIRTAMYSPHARAW